VGTIGLAYYEAAVSELSTVDGLSVGFAQASRSVTTGTFLLTDRKFCTLTVLLAVLLRVFFTCVALATEKTLFSSVLVVFS
jgi:hypothetical protein